MSVQDRKVSREFSPLNNRMLSIGNTVLKHGVKMYIHVHICVYKMCIHIHRKSVLKSEQEERQ